MILDETGALRWSSPPTCASAHEPAPSAPRWCPRFTGSPRAPPPHRGDG